MTDKLSSPRLAALQELEAALELHRRTRAQSAEQVGGGEASETGAITAGAAAAPSRWWLRWPPRMPAWPLSFRSRLHSLQLSPLWRALDLRHPILRRIMIAAAAMVVVVLAGGGALWWRLSSGPITLDLATPWLTAAIEQNFGSQYRVRVGGTQLERDEHGRTALRLIDIALRDESGTLVAIAPKAEVGISGASLLFARPQAESFRLVDANMTIRIDPDGHVNVLVGGDKPFAVVAPVRPNRPGPASSAQTDAVPTAPPPPKEPSLFQAVAERSMASNMAALVAWIDNFGRSNGNIRPGGALAGHDLRDIGITNGSLTIDDRRSGQVWEFKHISLSLHRPKEGGAALRVLSENPDRPWILQVALTPNRDNHRRLLLEARRVVLDDLLALQLGDVRFRSDTLISALVESDITADGTPHMINGSIMAQGGSIGDAADPRHRIPILSAEIGLDWDIARRTLRVPFKVSAGKARYTLRSEFAAPAQPGGRWQFAVGGGWIVLDPPGPGDEGLVLKRVNVRGNIDHLQRQVTIEHGDFGTKELGSKDDQDVTLAVSGKLDYRDEPRLAIGIAGNKMSASVFKRLWPSFIAPKVRDWVMDHVVSGTVERLDIATNTLLAALSTSGPPIPEEGLSIEIDGSGALLRPVAGLPPIRDADLRVRMTGRNAVVSLGKGTVDVSPGRRLTVSNGTFEVPDMRPVEPPATVRFRVEGSVAAAAELLALDRLRDFSGAPFDPAGTRGALSAQVSLGMPLRPDLPKGATAYDIAVDVTNFSAERMLFGQKVEAQALRAHATNKRYEIKGEAKVGGAPAQIEYRKVANEPDAEVRLQATLDEAARMRLGLDFGNAVAGALPMKLAGRVADGDQAGRFDVEADLTPVRIDNLLPGWVKPPGRPARVSFTVSGDKSRLRFDDLLVVGQGVHAKGSVDLDGNGEVLAANFPVFATSDADKVSLKADRGADGALRVVMRGDVYDGRNFVKLAMAGPPDPKAKARHPNLDLDVKLGVVAGHHGETLRGLELRMSRRAGRLRTFTLNAKIGRDTPLIGDIRTRVNTGKQVIYFETDDAGALFRFTDVYPRMIGGKMWIGMDPPSQDASPQEGLINVRDFAIRGEGALDRVVSGQSNAAARANAIEFTLARAEFVRTPGRMSIRDGVVRGPTVGATIEGNIDYVRDAVNVRGTLVPLYGLNNMFGQIPIVGLFLGGGSNEGIFGITYEVSGPTSNPRPMVNPISAIAPGVLRKFFEFRDTTQTDRAFAEPSR